MSGVGGVRHQNQTIRYPPEKPQGYGLGRRAAVSPSFGANPCTNRHTHQAGSDVAAPGRGLDADRATAPIKNRAAVRLRGSGRMKPRSAALSKTEHTGS